MSPAKGSTALPVGSAHHARTVTSTDAGGEGDADWAELILRSQGRVDRPAQWPEGAPGGPQHTWAQQQPQQQPLGHSRCLTLPLTWFSIPGSGPTQYNIETVLQDPKKKESLSPSGIFYCPSFFSLKSNSNLKLSSESTGKQWTATGKPL